MMTPRKHNSTMMRMLKRAARARREHGMALLFTLCILSMALITAMIFSSISSTSRKVAAAYVDSSSARILADGAVTRAMLALMQSDNASYACSNYKTCAPNGIPNDYSSDWIWKLEKTGVFSFNDGPLRFSKSVYYDRDDSRCPSWEYVYGKVYGDTTNERILGRYAYVAIGHVKESTFYPSHTFTKPKLPIKLSLPFGLDRPVVQLVNVYGDQAFFTVN